MGCCTKVKMPGGGIAIVCSRHRAKRCACGRAATLLCDWKVKGKRSGTCDVPLCERCTHSPATDKDICPQHAREWKARCEQKEANHHGKEARHGPAAQG